MIDRPCQVPSPSAGGWLLDLSATDGPRYVVLRLDEQQARDALGVHLIDIGAVETGEIADTMIDTASAETVAVIW